MIELIESKKSSWIKQKDIIKNKDALVIIDKIIKDLDEIIETSTNINAYQKACISLITNQNK